jgi:RNA polymerase sigma factor (sigma-70 family)
MVTAQQHTLSQILELAASSRTACSTDHQLLDDFTTRRDEAAFAALLARHGPMVLRVCRRVLGHEQDAEDAFQATFLVLARSAAVIRRHEALAGWLHGVAYRTAMKVKRSAARRRRHEARSPLPALPEASPTWAEVRAVLDEEIQLLPAHYRTAFTLCVLEGKSVPQAASELGHKLGTVSSWLTRARQRLQGRLAQRGIQLAGVLAALSVGESARAAIPAALARATIRFGLQVAAGGLAAWVIPSHIAELATGVTRAMSLTKAKFATAVLLAVAVIAGAGALAHQAPAAGQPPAEGPKSEAGPQGPKHASSRPPATDEEADCIEVSGRVVYPDGKPFAGARVFFARSTLAFRELPPTPPTCTSDDQGRFRLRVSRTGYQNAQEKSDWLRGAVVAVGAGFAPGWVGGNNAEKLANVTIKLSREVPVEGRVIDLQGKPVAGVRVQPQSVGFREDGGDLKDFVKSLEKHVYSFLGTTVDAGVMGLTRPTVTGADGRFRLSAGISSECVVGLRIEGPTIETVEVYTLTRSDPGVRFPLTALHFVYYGPRFDHAAAPTRPIVGRIRDKGTGKPIAGVTIRARIRSFVGFAERYVSATTDADGHYRLVGLSHNEGHELELLPAPGQPYLPGMRTLGIAAGLDPMTANFSWKQGVVIRGRVTDRETGRPVHAVVAYFAFADNPHLKEAPEFRGVDVHGAVHTAEDGSFTLVGLPGRGMLVAQAAGPLQDRYLMASGADTIKGPRLGKHFDTEPSLIDPSRFNLLAEVHPAADARSIPCDLVLDPGKAVTGTIVGPDGKPLKGATIEPVHSAGIGYRSGGLPSAEFRIRAIDPKHPRWFLFRYPGKNLAAVVLVKANDSAPLTVRLQKCATITGRVVDDDGLPRFAWILSGIEAGQLEDMGYFLDGGSHMFGTGKDGRFHIEGVVPGLKIAVYAGKNTSYFDPLAAGLTLKPGEIKDLGDVKAKPSQ